MIKWTNLSVVQVTQNTNDPQTSRLGLGFIYYNKGHIITNYHVVTGNNINEPFDITFIDGMMYSAEIVGGFIYYCNDNSSIRQGH
jgi:S1-C subfamily serine protease